MRASILSAGVGLGVLIGSSFGCVPQGAITEAITEETGAVTEPVTPIENQCGNGVLDSGEFCDAAQAAVACTSIGPVFTGGQAKCRSDCRGYEVSQCAQVNTEQQGYAGQYVIPKSRDAAVFGDAMCSFGEAFGFKLSLSPVKSKKWVVFLAGGGVCDGTVTPCTDRAEGLFRPSSLTEKSLSDIKSSESGVLSRDPVENPTFWDANFAIAEYCSNDLYSGTNTKPQTVLVGSSKNPTPRDVVFTGSKNVEALFGSLVRYFGLDDRDTQTRVLFAGNSAGGNGVQNTAHLAVNALPTAAKDQRIWFVSSAGYMLAGWSNLDWTLMGNGKSDQVNSETMVDIYQSRFSPECVALAKVDGHGSGACLSGLYAYRALTESLGQKRYLVFKNRIDQLYMSFHLMPLQKTATASFQDPARQEWLALTNTEMSSVKWLMAPADPQLNTGTLIQDNLHGIFKADLWDLVPPAPIQKNTCSSSAPTSFRDMVTRFWNDPSPGTSSERYCLEGDWVTWPAPK